MKRDGITSGAMRRRRRLGMTSGIFTTDEAQDLVSFGIDAGDYFAPKEPGGRVMSKMKEQTEQMEASEKALNASVRRFVSAAVQAEKDLKTASGKIRDANDKLGASITKFVQTAKGSDFSKTVIDTNHLVDALERLCFLQESGKLDKVMSAMGVKP